MVGTKTEMERLIKDTAKMKNIQNELNITVKEGDLSFGNIVNAISVMQKNLDITGTTAKEADATLQGSLSSMKASWQNFLSGSGGIEEVITTAKTVTKNLMRIAKEAITFIIKQVREALIKRGLGELVDFVEKTIKKLPKIIEQIATTLRRLSPIILAVVTALVAYKATMIAISMINIANNFLNTAKSLWNLVGEAKNAREALILLNNATKGLSTGILIASITAIITAISVLNLEQEKAKKSAESLGKGFTDFYNGIKTAESYLDNFNSELFASSEEQQKLQDEMQNIQKGITDICKTASDERRGYTQEEVTQLDEYFEKLRELSKREIEIQNSVAGAITQQAEQNANNFKGSLLEYQTEAQKWIKTAEEQKDKTLELIESQTIEEIALLNTRYGEEATMQNEAYAKEFNLIQDNKTNAIEQATEQVAKINSVYSKGYGDRNREQEGAIAKLQEYNQKQEEAEKKHNEEIRKIKDGELWYVTDKNSSIQSENDTFAFHQKERWNEMYKNMSEEQAKELGVWLAMVSQTELYGGEIDDETKKLVDSIIETYDYMPKETQETMKNAMSPMLEEMEKSEPSLFAKAKGIADGILSNLKKAFDIHSPSRKTREIFRFLMKGAQLGLDDEESKLNRQVTKIGNNILEKMKNAVNLETGKINANATVRSNANYNSVIQVNANFEGNMTMDNTKVGRIIAPSVAKAIKVGGLG